MEENEKKITTTVKDASNKHIDPRTGRIQEGPSEMGTTFTEENGVKIKNGSSTISVPNSIRGSVENMINGILNINVKSENSKSAAEYNNGRQSKMPQNSTSNGDKMMPAKRLLSEMQNSRRTPEYSMNSIMDSGYGSSDKLKITESNSFNNSNGNTNRPTNSTTQQSPEQQSTAAPLYSPVLAKRSSIKSSRNADLLHRSEQLIQAHRDSYQSDDEDNDRGSSGFVHLVGTSSSMKDTAYDRIVRASSRKKK